MSAIRFGLLSRDEEQNVCNAMKGNNATRTNALRQRISNYHTAFERNRKGHMMSKPIPRTSHGNVIWVDRYLVRVLIRATLLVRYYFSSKEMIVIECIGGRRAGSGIGNGFIRLRA